MKRIFYVPGLLSAVCIPLLFWYFGNRKYQDINLSVIDLGIPSKIDSTKDFAYQNIFEPYRNWNYKKIIVEPNTARKNSKLYVSEIINLQKQNQKETGLEFVIDDQNSYDDFISIINDFSIAKQEIFGVDLEKTGHIFALLDYKYSDAELEGYDVYTPIDYGSEMDWNAYRKYIRPKFFQRFETQLSQLPKQAFYLIFGYLFLFQISVLSLVKKYS